MLTLFFVLSSLVARAERPTPPRVGTIDLAAQYAYFLTTANYDQGGNVFTIPNNGGLSSDTIRLSGSYDFSRRVRGLIAAEYADASTTDGFTDRDNGAFTYVDLGGQYFTSAGQFLIVPDANIRVAAAHVDESANKAVMSEGVFTARAGGWGIWRLGEWQPFAYLGGEYRDAQRSSLIDYEAGVHFKEDQFYAQLEARGYFSVTNDVDANVTGRTRRLAFLQKVNGGSFRFYAPNPSLLEGALETGFDLSDFNLFVGASYTLAGNDQALGWSAWGGVRFKIPGRRARQRAVDGPGDPTGFEPKQDPYNDDAFSDRPTIKRSYPLRPRPSNENSGSDPRLKQQKNLNKLLKETEQEMEE